MSGQLTGYTESPKRHWFRDRYIQSYWFRLALKLWVPASSAVYLLGFSVYSNYVFAQSGATPKRLLAMLLIVAVVLTAITIVAAYVSKEWDDFALDSMRRQVDEAVGAARQWEQLAQFYSHLVNLLNELVWDKSEIYAEAFNRCGSDPAALGARLAEHDAIHGSLDRIVRTLHGSLHLYADIPSGRSFQVTFFVARDNQLVLSNFFNTTHQPPSSLTEDTHAELARHGNSLAALAWRTGEMITIPNTSEELRRPQSRFARFHASDEERIQSIVAYPVVDRFWAQGGGGEPLVGVVCVDCSHAYAFGPQNNTSLHFLLNTFATRIVFELRRGVCDTVRRRRGAV